ncbi:HlyD family efflux transporter periplasmic adaptor subunit [Nitrospina gracilis]|uniref:HlyD family efflux transporter periplasmic adaptor subunit n=1 Tax=Nitrospina gracilis TaxID=35801 RepID=UPI001F385FD9|nr:HlyD family efflux transporter periplasmic adaptor subunit [Nitrospina gracilis]MCF8721417.1 multidrug efflux pump subunit AcrA (membrane-fusion protein) [Nitrospina gracilis Nb-211]
MRPETGSETRGDPRRAFADPAQWKQLHEAVTAQEFAGAWLALQCSHVPGITRGVVVLGDPKTREYAPAAFWPEKKGIPLHLTGAVEMAMEQRKGVMRNPTQVNGKADAASKFSYLAHPFLVDGDLYGVVGVEVASRNPNTLRILMRQLQWGAVWVEQFYRRDRGKTPSGNKHLATILELITSGLEEERFHDAANAVVTDMAVKLGCERVTLGFTKGTKMRVVALSHSAKFNKKTNLIRDISRAMEECLDQAATILYPSPDPSYPFINRVHQELSKQHGKSGICTVPLIVHDHIIGALTFELSGGKRFSPEQTEVCEAIGQVVGPILYTKRRDDRNIVTKVVLSFWNVLTGLFGPRNLGWKLVCLLFAGVIAFFSFATTQFRVSADATLQGAVQRVMVAPLDGYISEALVRPGDIVEEEQVLFTLDDKDLVLERLKWKSELEKYRRQYRDVLAKFDRSEIRILKAQIEQAEAKLELAEKQLARTKVKSPFHGMVVSGDLSQSLGAPVERGEVMFELAPLDTYRVLLNVDERNINHVKLGQKGTLVLSGAVEQRLPFEVTKITPVTETKEGGNFFRVEARLGGNPDFLRPGMEGVGKIEIGERKLIWVLTREMINWLRLQLWTWWP